MSNMITKELEVDKIEVVGLWNVQVRTATVIKEGDEEISRSFHRHVLTPDSDMSEEDPRVVAVAEAAWTPEVRAAFDAFKEAQTDGVG
tara:strand:- start:3608 stop:3871 length:264 start_codon:yes stop_codon:yes gene_type:complete